MTTNTDQNETAQASCAPAAGYAAGVEYPATLIVHTPSGPVASCEQHAAKIKALMSFMGAYTNATPAPEGAECANCRNESKRQGGRRGGWGCAEKAPNEVKTQALNEKGQR